MSSKQLYKACCERDFKTVSKLLKLEKKLKEPNVLHKAKGIDVDFKYSKTSETPLMAAVRNNCEEIIEALILCSAQTNLRNDSGKTAMHIAMECKAPENIIKLLLKGKTDINLRDRIQNTPLHYACIHDHTVGAILLLQNKAKHKMLNGERRTCLDEAVINGSIKSCSIMVEEEDMHKNSTALFHALKSDQHLIISILLEGGT